MTTENRRCDGCGWPFEPLGEFSPITPTRVYVCLTPGTVIALCRTCDSIAQIVGRGSAQLGVDKISDDKPELETTEPSLPGAIEAAEQAPVAKCISGYGHLWEPTLERGDFTRWRCSFHGCFAAYNGYTNVHPPIFTPK